MDYRKKLKPVLIAAVSLTFIIAGLYFNFFAGDFPYTHDGENHLARFANYKIAIREGQFPPRWAPNLLNRYGYPVFNYNYPLSNILSLPFSVAGINYETTFKLLAFAYLFVGGLGIFFWMKKISFEAKYAGFFAAVWLSHPYIANLIYFRGNIGELAAVGLFPWLLWSLWKIKDSRLNRSWYLLMLVLFTAFLLSHNVAAVFGLPVLMLVAVLIFQKNIQAWWRLARILLMAFLLSAWFWIPAVAEMNLTVVAASANQAAYLNHFPTLSQLLFAPLEFGFSNPGPVDGLSFSLNWLIVLLAAVSLFFTRRSRTMMYLALTALLLFVLQLDITKPIWEAIPPTRFIQFPWRTGLFFAAASIPAAAYALKSMPKPWKMLIISVFLIQLIGISKLRAVDYFHRENIDYDAFTQTTSTQNENMPADFKYQNIADWQPGPTAQNETTNIKVQKWGGTSRSYEILNTETDTIIEPTAYYPGWITAITEKGAENNFRAEYINSAEIAGRIAYQLGPGDYLIQTRFTQRTPARIAGNLISVIAASYLVFATIKYRNKYE